ncbi:hypothetical protein [Roseibium sp.]|uniref:hypothetical protein n=1 Tax=Roseibium sp. TaxID=1936156 RepID=UPI003A9722A4
MAQAMQPMQYRPYGNTTSHLILNAYVLRTLNKFQASIDPPLSVGHQKRVAVMFRAYFASRRRRRAFHWKPALDLSNPRVAAALTTFAGN